MRLMLLQAHSSPSDQKMLQNDARNLPVNPNLYHAVSLCSYAVMDLLCVRI